MDAAFPIGDGRLADAKTVRQVRLAQTMGFSRLFDFSRR